MKPDTIGPQRNAMNSVDRSPESLAGIMRLLNGAFWFFIDLEYVLIALQFFRIRLSRITRASSLSVGLF